MESVKRVIFFTKTICSSSIPAGNMRYFIDLGSCRCPKLPTDFSEEAIFQEENNIKRLYVSNNQPLFLDLNNPSSVAIKQNIIHGADKRGGFPFQLTPNAEFTCITAI